LGSSLYANGPLGVDNGSSDGSVASVAAALAGPSKSTTPGIGSVLSRFLPRWAADCFCFCLYGTDDDLSAINAQEEEEEGIKGEPGKSPVGCVTRCYSRIRNVPDVKL
jgi:hypothetical protein